ncbi:MAG TPA: efflux RND transporter periplasmic adaptor subunit [Xanthobacteraceae bacterium]
MAPGPTSSRISAAIVAAIFALVIVLYWASHFGGPPKGGSATPVAHADVPSAAVGEHQDSIDLSDAQLSAVKVEPVGERDFPTEKEAVGSIDFDEEMSVQVFTPYAGRIINLFASVGDDVKKGQTLFTIDSPDLLTAESTLIAAAGVLQMTTRNLARLKELYTTRAVSQRDFDQGISDQQTAEGNVRAGRDAVRIFGKTNEEIDRIIAERKADPTLVVPCPIDGRVTARNAAPGLYVQPGSAPAPFTVANVDTMWMLANVAENDSPAFQVGQPLQVRISAFPDRLFDGKITTVGSIVDPNTRRVLVRSEVKNPQHELRAGMFANFVISVGAPVRSPAVALNGVVRQGDGTQTIWVTADRRRFVKRTVEIGQQRDGYRQILQGVQPGELVATDGAIFLSNMLATASAR